MARETRGGPASEKKLEQYGVWVKAEPREVLRSIDQGDSLELSDLEPAREVAVDLPDVSDDSPLTTEEEKLLDELETEIESAEDGEEALVPLDKASDEELPELELEPGHGEEIEVTLSDSLPAEEHFDDLQALEDELASVASSAGAGSEEHGQSAEILARIEEELRSIRTDLTELKRELAGLRRPHAEGKGASSRADMEAAGKFFDEDEDETIALTGDELDNILNTAEITEETAETPALEEEAPVRRPLAKAPADDALEDILSYETPILEEDRLAPLEADAAEEALGELEAEDEAGVDVDLAADLVLEQAPARSSAGAAGLPAELELEALPEIELVEEGGEPAEIEADLETVSELEAEPEELVSVEEIPEIEELAQPVEGPESSVDLEALAIENEEAAPMLDLDGPDDLEIGELEAVDEEKEGEIEIAFEAEPSRPPRASAMPRKPTAPAAPTAPEEPLEQLLEVEEVTDIDPAPAPAPFSGTKRPSEARSPSAGTSAVPDDLKDEIRAVLKYMDHLLEALPEDKIQEFASSDYFVMYKKLFEELGLGE
jgi:pilus assembly protein FimV